MREESGKENMTAEREAIRPHLTLIEVLIVFVLLSVAGFFLVRNMQEARHRAQLTEIIAAMDRSDHTRVIQLLRNNPELWDAKTRGGTTPLHMAAMGNATDAVKLLLSKGADPNAMGNEEKWTPLHSAAVFDAKEVAELLIANGAEVNAMHDSIGSPLHVAATRGAEGVVRLLLANGADINARAKNGKTALDNSHYYKSSPAVRRMLEEHEAK